MTFDELHADATKRLADDPLFDPEKSRRAILDAIAAKIEEAKRQHFSELNRQIYADAVNAYGPKYSPAPLWRRAARRARRYLVNVWEAICGREHDCDCSDYTER